MDKDTIIASLKNDLSKLEKQINRLNGDLVVQHQEITAHDLMKKAYEKEHNRKYEELKQTFYDLMDTYFKLKNEVIGLSLKQIREEKYKWMEKAGLLD